MIIHLPSNERSARIFRAANNALRIAPNSARVDIDSIFTLNISSSHITRNGMLLITLNCNALSSWRKPKRSHGISYARSNSGAHRRMRSSHIFICLPYNNAHAHAAAAIIFCRFSARCRRDVRRHAAWQCCATNNMSARDMSSITPRSANSVTRMASKMAVTSKPAKTHHRQQRGGVVTASGGVA